MMLLRLVVKAELLPLVFMRVFQLSDIYYRIADTMSSRMRIAS